MPQLIHSRQTSSEAPRTTAFAHVTVTALAALALLLISLAPSQAQTPAPPPPQQPIWDANGSAVGQGLTPTGSVTFTFDTPRSAFASQGARAGQLLLEIERGDGQNFSGIAYSFRQGCKPETFEVGGSITPDESVLTLKGRAPNRDASCKINSFADQTIVVKKQSLR